MTEDRPVVWQMVKEAVDSFIGPITYDQIKNYIYTKWGDVKSATINDQIHILTVNRPARIHHGYNQKSRLTNTGSPFDYLFSADDGIVEKYNPKIHGIWEIYISADSQFKIRKVESNISNNFLFVWNPDKWDWKELNEKIQELAHTGSTTELWSCQSHKQIKQGDRAFLVRVGSEPRGIIASGQVVSKPFLSKHWSGEDREAYRVIIDFDFLLNPATEPILALDLLKERVSNKQNWTPQSSGISIQSEIVTTLESVWFDFLTGNKQNTTFFSEDNNLQNQLIEGAAYEVRQTRYERNPHARKQCLNHYGYKCSVCTMDFESRYGDLGKDFIHVHHLKLISSRGKEHMVDPILDLRPVCPNCHSMLHKENPPLSIEDLKKRLRN